MIAQNVYLYFFVTIHVWYSNMPHSGFCILVHHSISKALKKVLRWALGATRSGSLERPLRILCDSPPLLRSTMEQFIFVEILFSNRSNFTGERPMNKFKGWNSQQLLYAMKVCILWFTTAWQVLHTKDHLNPITSMKSGAKTRFLLKA